MQKQEIEKYIDYLFGAALKKCGDLEDAEDLTQEVLLAALSQVSYSKDISNVKVWLSSVLNHKCYDVLRRKYKLPTVSIDLVPEIKEPFIVEDLDDRPDAIQIRREVAYLAELYREIITRHYLYGDGVHKSADDLKIPKGTVLSRLSSGREQIRKGFDEMENYEKQSYQPERLDLSCHGRPGLHEEPWSLINRDMMKQNILITAYDKPVVDIPILNSGQYQEMGRLRIRKMHELADRLTEPLSIELPNLELQIPKHLEGRVAEFRRYACYAILMATLKYAIANGDFLKDVTYPCPPMVLVIDR